MSAINDTEFGEQINAQTILDTFDQQRGWENRYRTIIQLGKKLPEMPDELRVEANQVRGCESQAWVSHELRQDKFWFWLDSETRIVKGLMAIVLAAYNGKTAQQISKFDIQDYFVQLGLIKHLSPSRTNGLNAVVSAIRQVSQE